MIMSFLVSLGNSHMIFLSVMMTTLQKILCLSEMLKYKYKYNLYCHLRIDFYQLCIYCDQVMYWVKKPGICSIFTVLYCHSTRQYKAVQILQIPGFFLRSTFCTRTCAVYSLTQQASLPNHTFSIYFSTKTITGRGVNRSAEPPPPELYRHRPVWNFFLNFCMFFSQKIEHKSGFLRNQTLH